MTAREKRHLDEVLSRIGTPRAPSAEEITAAKAADRVTDLALRRCSICKHFSAGYDMLDGPGSRTRAIAKGSCGHESARLSRYELVGPYGKKTLPYAVEMRSDAAFCGETGLWFEEALQ